MEYLQRVRKTDLARSTHRVIRDVQRGYTVLVESHGQVEAAIMDILDYRILRAFMAYHTRPPELNPKGLNADIIVVLDDPQQVCDLVLAHCLAGAISLGKAADCWNSKPWTSRLVSSAWTCRSTWGPKTKRRPWKKSRPPESSKSKARHHADIAAKLNPVG